MRVLVAGVLGGIAMFIWASVAHVMTPLATIGLQAMPDEAAVIAQLHQSLGDRGGLYFFPFMHGAYNDSSAMAAQEAKLRVQPAGLLAYVPPGTPGISGRQLGVEFALEVVESLIAACIVASVVAGSFARRVGVAALIGVVAAMATNFSYWNWYGFSFDYTLANAFTELMKFVVAGVAIALVLGWRRRPAPAI